MSSSHPRPRCRRALTLAAGLALLAPAALASANSFVRLDFFGTSHFTDYSVDPLGISGSEAFAASFTYNPAALPILPDLPPTVLDSAAFPSVDPVTHATLPPIDPVAFPLADYSGFNSGLSPISNVFLWDNIPQLGTDGLLHPVDVLSFVNQALPLAAPLSSVLTNTITLITPPDFLNGLQLPSLAAFQSALADNLILPPIATGNAAPVLLFAPTLSFSPSLTPSSSANFDYTATITSITASEVPAAAVPTPAAAVAALPLLALTYAARARRRRHSA